MYEVYLSPCFLAPPYMVDFQSPTKTIYTDPPCNVSTSTSHLRNTLLNLKDKSLLLLLMEISSLSKTVALLVLLLATLTTLSLGQGNRGSGRGTRLGYYRSSCPRAESIVQSAVRSAVQANPTIAPGLLRMFFHDCFVNGCDASILIDGPTTEKTAGPNSLLRGFEVIDAAKSQLETACPGVVSCADIVALAARDSVVLTGGRSWQVRLGRRDGLVSQASDTANLPAFNDPISVQIRKFADKGLNTQDLVTLVGGHTIGTAASCPGVISCADIVALAARDSVVLTGGCSWQVRLGRRDGFVSQASDTANLPAFNDPISVQIRKFADKGLNTKDLVTLVGGHTIGTAACALFSYRLYNFNNTNGPDPDINPAFLPQLRALCPNGGDALRRVALDTGSDNSFGNSFYENLRNRRGVIESDAKLWSDRRTQRFVQRYLGERGQTGSRFNAEFGRAMVKMGNIEVKTGTQGEIRRVCTATN
ncbi:putative peroxidase [Helianthus annuus]|uniref:peroxidase n=1 Tax=Helianthus annuus TaxID=4232 RepID=A0A9K3N4X6_HELAN|nr:putative peroxidase [Helianthus annuus]